MEHTVDVVASMVMATVNPDEAVAVGVYVEPPTAAALGAVEVTVIVWLDLAKGAGTLEDTVEEAVWAAPAMDAISPSATAEPKIAHTASRTKCATGVREYENFPYICPPPLKEGATTPSIASGEMVRGARKSTKFFLFCSSA
jgi:hypothetical protein